MASIKEVEGYRKQEEEEEESRKKRREKEKRKMEKEKKGKEKEAQESSEGSDGSDVTYPLTDDITLDDYTLCLIYHAGREPRRPGKPWEYERLRVVVGYGMLHLTVRECNDIDLREVIGILLDEKEELTRVVRLVAERVGAKYDLTEVIKYIYRKAQKGEPMPSFQTVLEEVKAETEAKAKASGKKPK